MNCLSYNHYFVQNKELEEVKMLIRESHHKVESQVTDHAFFVNDLHVYQMDNGHAMEPFDHSSSSELLLT